MTGSPSSPRPRASSTSSLGRAPCASTCSPSSRRSSTASARRLWAGPDRPGGSTLRCPDLRTATDVHRTTTPLRRRGRMVLRPEPSSPSVEAVAPPRPLYLLGPGGRRFDQALARRLAGGDGFSLLCGRYEGVDHRIREHLGRRWLSIGDYVLAGGEVAACVLVEAVTRLLPGVMGNERSAEAGPSAPAARSCWRSPSTPDRPRSGAGTCPRSSARATTGAWPGGAGPRPSTEPARPGPTCSRPGEASPTRRPGCWKRSTPSPILERSPPGTPSSTRRTSAP
jgi:hypothetical protein